MGIEIEELSVHEIKLLSMTPKQAQRYLDGLDEESEELVDKKLELLKRRDRYIEKIDNMIATLDVRQREINQDRAIIEGAYIGLLDSNEDYDEIAYLAGVRY